VSSAARHALREGLLWGAVVLAGLAFFYYFDDLRSAFGPGGKGLSSLSELRSARPDEVEKEQSGFNREVTLKADPRGHFVFDGEINDRPVTFMADTGASVVFLTYEDAERLGLSPRSLDFSASAATANGTSRVAPVTLDRVSVDDITVRDVPAAVAEKGALATNLLGMSFLGRLSSFQMKGHELVLVQ
jgi:aspartyl protease family protein